MATSRRVIHLIPLLGLLALGLSSATRLLLEPIPLASQPRSSPEVVIPGTETADHDTAEQKGVVGEAGQGHNIIWVKRARGNSCGQSCSNVFSGEIHIPGIGVPSLDLPGIGGMPSLGIPSLDLPGIGLPGIHFPGINIGGDATEHDEYKCSPVNPNPPCAPSCNNPSSCCNNPPPCAPNCYSIPTHPPPCTLPGCYMDIHDTSNNTSQHETDSSSSKSLEGLDTKLRAVRPKLDERVPDVLSTRIDSYRTEPKPPATPPMT